ncbi:hypothetical protein ACWD00_42000 [Streptomyces viridiviolaceus]
MLSVMSGQTTSAEAAGKYGVPEEEVDTWKRQFLDGDWFAWFMQGGEGGFPFCP